MNRSVIWRLPFVVGAWLIMLSSSQLNPLEAGIEWTWCPCRACEPQTPEERMARAGYPECISRIAHVSEERADCGYYVGGAACCGHGEQRYANEGTWGWDYAPWYSRVRVGWTHGRRYGGGEGQYQQNRCNNPLRDLYNH